jgi:hypothetical protein
MNATIALRAKKIRAFIIAHPGCTKEDVYAAHKGENLGGGFALLQNHGLARFEGGGKKGPAKWFPVEAVSRNFPPVLESDHQ